MRGIGQASILEADNSSFENSHKKVYSQYHDSAKMESKEIVLEKPSEIRASVQRSADKRSRMTFEPNHSDQFNKTNSNKDKDGILA